MYCYKNSIRILNQYTFLQCLMKCMNMGIVYLFYKVLIILEIKVALISCSLSKAASKAAENNRLIAADKPPAGSTLARVGLWANRWWLPQETAVTRVVRLTGCSPYGSHLGHNGLTLYVLNFSERKKTCIYISCHSSSLTWHRWLKSFFSVGQERTYST